MVEASQAGAEGCAIEVHEESRGISRDLQVGDHLREAHGVQVVDGFSSTTMQSLTRTGDQETKR